MSQTNEVIAGSNDHPAIKKCECRRLYSGPAVSCGQCPPLESVPSGQPEPDFAKTREAIALFGRGGTMNDYADALNAIARVLSQAEARLALLTQQLQAARGEAIASYAQAESLRAENAQLRKDRERLDWLENMRHRLSVSLANEQGARDFVAFIEQPYDGEGGVRSKVFRGAHPREAIDAARSASPGETPEPQP